MVEGSETEKTILGWEIIYADESRFTSKDFGGWIVGPSENVQIVAIWYEEVYNRWVSDDQRFVTENYKTIITQHDFYWMDLRGIISGGNVNEVPNSLPAGSVKIGSLVADETFFRIYELIRKERVWTD